MKIDDNKNNDNWQTRSVVTEGIPWLLTP